jgi:hypothetical protein
MSSCGNMTTDTTYTRVVNDLHTQCARSHARSVGGSRPNGRNKSLKNAAFSLNAMTHKENILMA